MQWLRVIRFVELCFILYMKISRSSILKSVMLCDRREKHDIPLLVQTCVDEVQRRGMDETGIYRVAGVISDIGALRKAFDTGDPSMSLLLLPLLS